ncbi:efflux RND transporter permease subunit [Ralstonia solanacearum]|uniref:Transporter n=1 Tax=Ralstonia solanacearum TaxID=305 RepID=A0AAD0WH80_RALSL|nr:efflux RND transporter permease subunit [Ralstonia solanacearum]AXV81737.1 transporter [Ralstonia solanacearum]AXW52873.1 transporter [Ralstonia solanacearum]
MNFATWMQTHRRSLLFVVAMIAVAGALMAWQLPISLFPNVQFPRVVVSLDAGDRPAEQMTALVTMPVEEALHRTPNVRSVQSRTSRGAAEVAVNFDWGTDMAQATLQVQSSLAEIMGNLPAGTTTRVRRMDPTVFPIIAYSLTSTTLTPAALYNLAQYQVRPLLSSVAGVSRVEASGGARDELEVTVDPVRLAARKLSIADVVRTVAASNILMATGRIEDHYKLYLAIAQSTVTTPQALGNVVVQSSPGVQVRLGDVATVSSGTVPQWLRVTANGRDAVLLNVYQQPGANSVSIARDIGARLDAFKAQLPPDVKLSNWYDQSELVVASAASVRDAMLIGIALAAFTLLAFLRNWKITVIAVAQVPVVMAATLLVLHVFGMGLNIMTLGGMAAAVGLIIDDAIVMIEQIVRRLHARGSEEFHGSVMAAALEFTRPLAGSSAATLVIFAPLAFLSGVTGAFFKALSITMASALFVSFFVTWLAIPLVCDRWLKPSDAHAEDAGRIARWVDQRYRRLVESVTHRPWKVLLGVIPLVLISALAFTRVGSGFMPSMDEGGFILDYHTTPGTSVSETDRLIRQIETIVQANPNVQTYSRRTGVGLGGGLGEPNRGDFFIRLKSGNRAPIGTVMDQIRTQVETRVPGVTIELAQLMEDLIGDLTAVPQPVQIKIYADDQQVLDATARKVGAAIAHVPGIVDINNGINPAGDALSIEIRPDAAAAENMDPQSIAQQIADLLAGNVATAFQSGVQTVGIRVRLDGAQSLTDTQLAQLMLRAPDGHLVPVGRVATLVPVSGQPEINRDNLKQMVAVTARISGRDLGSVIADVKHVLDTQQLLPKGSYYELGGLYQQQQIAFHGLLIVFAAAVTLVFALLLFLYERFRVAAAILIMPLLSAGAVFIGLWLTQIELNITAMMGMTMIIGIVTEVAIFYVSELQGLVRQGVPLEQALIDAGRNRMRPIVMTTIAAIFALLPLAFALGQGSAMQQPLAIAIIAGLVVQMPLVLLLLPALLRLVLSKGAHAATHVL